jgi:hypothetical protein
MAKVITRFFIFCLVFGLMGGAYAQDKLKDPDIKKSDEGKTAKVVTEKGQKGVKSESSEKLTGEPAKLQKDEEIRKVEKKSLLKRILGGKDTPEGAQKTSAKGARDKSSKEGAVVKKDTGEEPILKQELEKDKKPD